MSADDNKIDQNTIPEQSPINVNIDVHYYDFGFIHGISYEEDGKDIDLFPMEITSDEMTQYSPDLSLLAPTQSISFQNINTEIIDGLIESSQSTDVEFIHFLQENLPKEEYLRFMIEQFVAKRHFDAEKKEGDRYSLTMKWNNYYPSPHTISRDMTHLPTCTEKIRTLYATNKLFAILSKPKGHDFVKETFFDDEELKLLRDNMSYFFRINDPDFGTGYAEEVFSEDINNQYLVTSKLFDRYFSKEEISNKEIADEMERIVFDFIKESTSRIKLKKQQSHSDLAMRILQDRASFLSDF